jgi:DNA-binding transcriptional LysR family regulator
VVVASPTLTLTLTLPRPAPGETVPAVARSLADARAWALKTPDGQETMAIKPVLALSSLIMVRDAARTGLAAARLPISLVSHDLAEGTLVHWGDIEAPDIPLWTLYPSRRLLSARVSAFLEYLREVFPTGAPEELAGFVGR